MNEQPLAVGAMAFGLGLASGLSVPTTRWEDETMGGAADEVKREARSATESVKEAAKATASAAKDEVDRQDVSGQLEESARQVAARAKEEAKEQVREKDLDSDGVKERASKAGHRVRERSGD